LIAATDRTFFDLDVTGGSSELGRICKLNLYVIARKIDEEYLHKALCQAKKLTMHQGGYAWPG